MTQEQYDWLVEKIMTMPPAEFFSRVYIDRDGIPRELSQDDPPFFARVMSEPKRAAFYDAPKTGAVHRRHNIPERTRREVIAHDGSWCYLCGSDVLMGGLHLDHIIPVARGGTNDASNLAVSCADCNMAKGDRLSDKRPPKVG